MFNVRMIVPRYSPILLGVLVLGSRPHQSGTVFSWAQCFWGIGWTSAVDYSIFLGLFPGRTSLFSLTARVLDSDVTFDLEPVSTPNIFTVNLDKRWTKALVGAATLTSRFSSRGYQNIDEGFAGTFCSAAELVQDRRSVIFMAYFHILSNWNWEVRTSQVLKVWVAWAWWRFFFFFCVDGWDSSLNAGQREWNWELRWDVASHQHPGKSLGLEARKNIWRSNMIKQSSQKFHQKTNNPQKTPNPFGFPFPPATLAAPMPWASPDISNALDPSIPNGFMAQVSAIVASTSKRRGANGEVCGQKKRFWAKKTSTDSLGGPFWKKNNSEYLRVLCSFPWFVCHSWSVFLDFDLFGMRQNGRKREFRSTSGSTQHILKWLRAWNNFKKSPLGSAKTVAAIAFLETRHFWKGAQFGRPTSLIFC